MTILDPLTGQTVTIGAIRAVPRRPRNPGRADDANRREVLPMMPLEKIGIVLIASGTLLFIWIFLPLVGITG
jgi:hypothetical protein